MVGWTKTRTGVENQGGLRRTRRGWSCETEGEQHFEESVRLLSGVEEHKPDWWHVRQFWKRQIWNEVTDPVSEAEVIDLCITITVIQPSKWKVVCCHIMIQAFSRTIAGGHSWIDQAVVSNSLEWMHWQRRQCFKIFMDAQKFLFPAHTEFPLSPFSSKCHLFLWLVRGGGG